MTDPLQPTNSAPDSEDDFNRLVVDDAVRPETLPAQLDRHFRPWLVWLKEGGHPQRTFWLSVTGFLLGLFILTLAPKGLLWLNSVKGYPWDGWLEFAFTALIGIKSHWSLAALTQVVLWWQLRFPKRPPLWQACLLAIVFSLATSLFDWGLSNDWQMPLPLFGYMIASMLVSFAIYLFWFRTLSIGVCFWLIDRNSDGNDPSLPPKPRGWSIRGLFFLTLLAATLLTMMRIGQRVLESIGGVAMAVDFQWVLLASWILEMLVTVVIAIVAAWHCIRPSWRIVLTAIATAVGIRFSGQMVAQAIVTPQTGVSMHYPSVWEIVLSCSMVLFLHCICFRLWQHAGFELIGWTARDGYRTARRSPDECERMTGGS